MNIHVFPFKIKHKYIIKELKKGTRFLVVQISGSSERATSKIVLLAKGFSEPLMIRSRNNSGGNTEGKILSQGFKKTQTNQKKKKNILCLKSFKRIWLF